LSAAAAAPRLVFVRRVTRWVLALVLAVAPLAATAGPDGRVRVIDGDTIDVGGERVRLFGIDAPERDQLCWEADGSAVRCGEWSGRVLARFAEGRRAECEAIRPDRYGRTLATCTVRGVDLGETLLRNGVVLTYSGETLRDYPEFEKEAELLGRGLWAWRHDDPAAFRANQRAPAAPASPSPEGCVIKGNISNSGRIYHLPGQEHYGVTRISPSRGERWFCSEAEARSAGWRRAKR